MNIDYASIMAELAEASYARFDIFADQKTALTTGSEDINGVGFSDTQAMEFLQAWSLVSGSHQEDTSSGFSATVFQGKSEAEDLSGEYVLAIRGTAGSADLSTDGGDIVLDGLAVDQIIDLYNYTLARTSVRS